MQVMKVFEKKWRSQGIICFIYLNDILLFRASSKLVREHLLILIQDILEADFKVNTKKCVLEPTQFINHFGFDLNLKEGKLQISAKKLKMVERKRSWANWLQKAI
jgi:hypothetical protein